MLTRVDYNVPSLRTRLSKSWQREIKAFRALHKIPPSPQHYSLHPPPTDHPSTPAPSNIPLNLRQSELLALLHLVLWKVPVRTEAP